MKIVPTLGFLFMVAMFTPVAWSQCATGVDTGGQCIPPDALPGADQNQQAQPQQPRAIWATRWGAIAMDDSGAEGHITDQPSKSQAESTAMNFCAKHGGKKCEILVWYSNECAAIAQVQGGRGFLGHATGADSQKAESEAMSLCGQDTCRIVYSACSLPVRIQ